MELLGRCIARHARWIVAATVIVLAFCGLYSTQLGGRLSGAGWTVPGSEEARAERAQDAGFAGRGSSSITLAIRDDRFGAASPEFAPRISAAVQQIAADPRLEVRGPAPGSAPPTGLGAAPRAAAGPRPRPRPAHHAQHPRTRYR